MKKCRVVYFRTLSGREPARDYIHSLPAQDRARITADLELVEAYGIEKAPVVTRKLQGKGKLWEIKTGTHNQQRIFYCTQSGKLVVLLHACKKQKESGQKRDIDVAYNRMMEIQNE
jgi:phage-related protein